ncbi:YvrJ family protein [Anaeromicrobium sediminis]|uniref:YvrJ family protein n=1 Tax=Anaeromicrobium sediminis TaxID=1478221 RepID=A0A267MF68_9FIRM|nr:YvrJ family protein [Anaeromicrobium sediminis]PAB57525.1 YvrJ family protein [Anaeromicrobium sediminis]
MEEIYTHIANLGFPIVVSMYLLMRIEGKLESLTKSIIDLSNNISKLEKI